MDEASSNLDPDSTTPQALLRTALLDEDLAGFPLLLFVRSAESLARAGKPDMSTGGPVVTAMQPREVVELIGGPSVIGERPWRVQSCDFGCKPMLGVAAGLAWLYRVFNRGGEIQSFS